MEIDEEGVNICVRGEKINKAREREMHKYIDENYSRSRSPRGTRIS